MQCHVFHPRDLRKLFLSCRWDVAPVSIATLPAHYPIHMYHTVARAIQQQSCVVQPLLPRAMRLANLRVASLL